MRLKQNNGYVGVDITISLLVLVILIPTITAMTFNINTVKNEIKRKTQAVSIATNTMEESKIVFNEKDGIIDEYFLAELKEKLETTYGNDILEEKNQNKLEGAVEIDKSAYQIIINIKDKNEIDNTVELGKIKVIDAEIKYKVGNRIEKINLWTNFVTK